MIRIRCINPKPGRLVQLSPEWKKWHCRILPPDGNLKGARSYYLYPNDICLVVEGRTEPERPMIKVLVNEVVVEVHEDVFVYLDKE